MDWKQLLWDLWVILREHWIKAAISFVFLIVGAWIGKRRARRAWERKRFLDRINFSLNLIHDNTLQIRTLVEKNCRDVFLNDIAVDRVLAAARRTTDANPILPLDRAERWYLLNAVLNEISERFATGFVRREMGLPVQSAQYLVCLTYEVAGELKTQKVRAMIVRKDLLLRLPTDPPRFERPHHSTRWATLHQLAEQYAIDSTHFLDVEICV